MLTSRKTLKDRPVLLLFAEFMIVMLSVLLALGLDSWRESRASQELAEKSLQNFEREIAMNRAEIQDAYDHHTELLVEVMDGTMGVTLNTATIENSAWEVVKTTGAIMEIDFDTIEIASRVYELQRRYQRIEESSTEIIYQGNFQFVESDIDELNEELMRSALGNLVIRLLNAERALLNAYDEYDAHS